MIIELIIPSAGETITEVAVGTWLIEDMAVVEKDQEIAEIESDKATLPLIAPDAGKVHIMIPAGAKAQVGDVAGTIDTSVKAAHEAPKQAGKQSKKKQEPVLVREPVSQVSEEAPQPEVMPEKKDMPGKKEDDLKRVKVTPLARNVMDEHHMDVEAIISGLKKLTRQDVEKVVNQFKAPAAKPAETANAERAEESTPMSPLRRKLSKRLVAVKNETAMLTTFNEVDMSALMELRKKYQAAFQEKHGLKLGLMSFFLKASAEALKSFPRLNSMIDGDNIISPNFVDIAFAVQTDKGLMVPVIRNVHSMGLADIEKSLAELAKKARTARLTIEEMTGGTFTITNGGVFGSMLSTPILNPPQSAILGMHNIVDRPVAVNGKVEIRPVMYVALSYDHRLIDGRDSVSFLVKVKEFIEFPANLILGSSDPEKLLLDIGD